VGESAREILSAGAAELGVTLDGRQLDMFEAFTALLLEWNSRFNLTRITDPKEIATKHYLDSLSLLAVVKVPAGASMIDVGTGAGFPGIPLKIALPDLKVTMLDSVRKKLTFLDKAVRELNLTEVALVHGRAEDMGRDVSYRERFDFAVSRAVARLNVLAELCMPFCRIGGRFAAYKGPDAGEEIEEAAEAVRALGGELEAVHSFALPEGDLQRTLVVIRKTRPTPARYPRKAGIPERNPLQRPNRMEVH